MKWLIALVLLVGLMPSPVYAESDAEVLITASGYVVTAPTGFTLTYISDYEIGVDWMKHPLAENTMVRAKYGSYPEDRTDGYLVYYGTGTSTSDTSVNFDETPSRLYYRAWSEDVGGMWSDYAEDNIGGWHVALLTFALIALGLTWFSTRRPEMLLRLAASFMWLGLAFWIVLGDTVLSTDDSFAWIIIGVLLLMTFVPLVFQINTEVRTEKKGKMWSNWQRNFEGEPEESEYERYRSELRARTRRSRRRY